MESSSENSFTWTDTSSDSVDSHSMTADVEAFNRNTESNNKHVKSSKAKELLKNSCNEILDDSTVKVKIEKEQSYSETKSTSNSKKRMVKLEPESDNDVTRKKKKTKHIKGEANSKETFSQDSASYDESYLNLRVKEEEMCTPISTIKSVKKRKLSDINDFDSRSSEKLVQKGHTSDVDKESASQRIQYDEASVKTKKKKKKSRKRSESEYPNKIEIDDYSEESKHNISKKSAAGADESVTDLSLTRNNTFQDESGYDEISAIQCDDDHNLHTISFTNHKTFEHENMKNNSLYKSTILNQNKLAKNDVDHDSKIMVTEKRTSRISDRIRFEDEEEPDFESRHAHENKVNKTTSKLRKYVSAKSSTRLVSQQLDKNSILTQDDEIWIIKCPKQIDIQAFCNSDLNVNGKCKIKVAGQTYDSSLENEQCHSTAALSMQHSRYGIENLPLCGIINMRKRIPKAHFCDDNIIVNNQTNFIPLPDTKCRHPLFGSNYKKALRIPATVAERLNLQNGEQLAMTVEKKKKKKHKVEKNVTDYVDTDAKSEVKIANAEQASALKVPEKKKKKRKYVDDDGPEPKRVKRIKHDPDSAEAWESEQAIEQNLFNF